MKKNFKHQLNQFVLELGEVLRKVFEEIKKPTDILKCCMVGSVSTPRKYFFSPLIREYVMSITVYLNLTLFTAFLGPINNLSFVGRGVSEVR